MSDSTDKRIGGWICTYTGRHFWPFDARPEDVDAKDIAHALSNLCRFTGHVRKFYSVAEHCCRVSHAIFEASRPGFDRIASCLWGLIHDASEAYLCDIARPVKRAPEMQLYRDAEKRLDKVIAKHFNAPICKSTGGASSIVKQYDEILLVTEARDLMNGFDDRWHHWSMRDKALPERISPWPPQKAEDTWLHLLDKTLTALTQWREKNKEEAA